MKKCYATNDQMSTCSYLGKIEGQRSWLTFFLACVEHTDLIGEGRDWNILPPNPYFQCLFTGEAFKVHLPLTFTVHQGPDCSLCLGESPITFLFSAEKEKGRLSMYSASTH